MAVTRPITTHIDYRYGRWILAHRWLIICIVSALAILATLGTAYLTHDPDGRVFFSADNPHLMALEKLEQTYTKTDNVFIVLASQDGDVFTARTLQAIRELTETAWQIPYSNRVDSITNYQYTRAAEDELIVSELVADELILDEPTLQRLRAIATSRPELRNRLISGDARVTGINITVIKPGLSNEEVPEIVAFARQIVADFRQRYPELSFYLSGGAMYDAAFAEIPEQENTTLLPIMFGLILLIIGIALRTFWGSLSVLILIALSVAVTLGLTGWSGAVLNAGTIGAPVIILTLSVAHCVHILSSMNQTMLGGQPRHQAIIESLRINIAPIFITSITTAIGFLSLNFSDAPPFRLLGNMVATGVIIAFILSVTLLPAILAVLPIKVTPKRTLGEHLMNALGEFVIRNRQRLLWTTGSLIVFLSLGIMHIELDDNFLKYFDQRFSIRTDTDFIEQHLTGMNIIEYSIPAGEEGGINDPAYLANLERFVSWLEQQPKIVNVSSITRVIKQLNKSMNGDDPAYYRLPESRELAAQYLLIYEMSLPYGLDLNNQINVAKSESRVAALITETTSKELRELDAAAQRWLKANMPEMQAPGTGLSMIFSYISERNINTMLFGSLFALVLISLILIFALRSVRIGLISLMPNLFPAAMALGLWGYFVGEVGLSVAVVVAVTLGIVVDDTVHFLSKDLRALREYAMTSADAIRYTFRTVGMALWITSITLISGFAALFFSGFKVSAEMGLLSAITIALALLADFLFLPPVLMLLDKTGVSTDKPRVR